MVAKVVGVSIKEEHKKFLDENEYFSPSEMLQNCINEAIAFKKSLTMEKEQMIKNIERLNAEIQLYNEFLDLNDLNKKFWAWRGERKNVAI